MTAMPCGQKNSSNAKDHSHTVTPPLAAMVGTTLRLTMATTNNKTRSPGPRTRRKRRAPGAAGAPEHTSAHRSLPPLVYHNLLSHRTQQNKSLPLPGLSDSRLGVVHVTLV